MPGKAMNKEWYLGLDMGTNSLGWAVTDTAYQVIKKNGKALWGIRGHSAVPGGLTCCRNSLRKPSRRKTRDFFSG